MSTQQTVPAVEHRIEIIPDSVGLIEHWLLNRGGVALWVSVGYVNINSMLTPALDADGWYYQRPHWQYPSQPSKIVSDASEIDVLVLEMKAVRGNKKCEVYSHVPLDEYVRRQEEQEKKGCDL